MKFSLKPKQRWIRVLAVPRAKFLVKPMTASEDLELSRQFQEYDSRAKEYRVKDVAGLIRTKAVRVILGWSGLPGDDGKDIPFTTQNLDAMCEMHLGVITDVLAESGRADAIEAEADEKN